MSVFFDFSLRPLHYHNISSNAPTQMPPIGNTKPEFGSSTLEEVQNSRSKCEDEIMDLKRKIGQLTSDVERLQRHLDTNNTIRKPWRWIQYFFNIYPYTFSRIHTYPTINKLTVHMWLPTYLLNYDCLTIKVSLL